MSDDARDMWRAYNQDGSKRWQEGGDPVSEEKSEAPEGYRNLPGFLYIKACLRCGALVTDTELHTAWHGRLTGPPVRPS